MGWMVLAERHEAGVEYVSHETDLAVLDCERARAESSRILEQYGIHGDRSRDLAGPGAAAAAR